MNKYDKLHTESLNVAKKADEGNKADFDEMYDLVGKYDYALKETIEYCNKLEKLLIKKEFGNYGMI